MKMADDYYSGRLVTEYTVTCANCGLRWQMGNHKSRGYAFAALREAGWKAFKGTGFHCPQCAVAKVKAKYERP